MKALRVSIILLSLCFGCNDTENTSTFTPIINVEPEFMEYYQSFINEMQTRGIDLSNRSISIVSVNALSAPNSSQYCAYGYPNFVGSGHARVEVITNFNCWERRSDTEKENLMYHEFGHALFNRNHYSALMPNGSQRSIMCTSICSNYRVYNAYQTEQRSYYLDELANTSTPVPSWATAKSFSAMLYQDNFDNPQDGWLSETITVNGTAQTDPYSYFVETANVFSPPNALGIASLVNSETNSGGNWYKDFNLESFNYCDNLVVRTDVITENLTDGYFAIIVDLYDDSNTGVEFGRYYHIIDDSSGFGINAHENLEVTVTCLPLETAYIKVRFYLETFSDTQVYIDNLEIELHQ
ncbi:hypothetical protein [Winogradskyella sp.]|uniref:hypothetical protein n=1 Tax=Winogradskyella sp. TaxID=1883156 RepID=UPI003519A807